MAGANRYGSMMRLRHRLGRLGMAALGSMLLGTIPLSTATRAQAPSPQLAAAQAAFEGLPEAERKAIQTDLIWVGLLNSAATGGYGPLTFRAINQAKGGKGQADGMLSPRERQALNEAARVARDAVGFKLITDARTGVRIGVPDKLLPKYEVTPAGSSRWQSADGRITLDATATPANEPLEAVFEKATAVNPNNPSRKITYKLLRPDFFVVSGETPTGKFYRRLALGPQGLRGFSIGYDKALASTVDRLVIAVASSFEPFPTGAAPVSGPAVASVARPVQTLPPRPSERYGVALAVAETLALTASSGLDGCKSVDVAGKPARLRGKVAGDRLALLEITGGVAMPRMRGEPLGDHEPLLLLAFGEEAGTRNAVALPGTATGTGDALAALAPLQPGQAGAPAFDRQGRLVGIVAANPSDKVLIAGIAPQRSYGLVAGKPLADALAAAGVPAAGAPSGGDLSTGALVQKLRPAVLPVVCRL